MTRLYKLSNHTPVQVASGKLANENMIQNWIAERPELLGLDLLIIGREVVAPDRGRIDLLGKDEEGNLSILELKRDRTPREVIAQALDYASWIVTLSTREVWPAPGSADTELGVLMEPEVSHGKAEVYTRVQA
jgi:RecB family endonuclease NucS